MNEDEARAWLETAAGVSRETMRRLERFVQLLLAEAEHQNLISRSTSDAVWARHIVDSAQLLRFVPERASRWCDLGSGAGLPGIVIASASDHKITLVDSRRKRVEFLRQVIEDLKLTNASVELSRVEAFAAKPFRIISARAYAPLPRIFSSAQHLGDRDSFWLLPKGKSWQSEIELARADWAGSFHVEHSVTDPESAIVVARGLHRKGRK